MRRPTATTLLLLMLAAVLAPTALATASNPMPACCRAAGPHHCSAKVPGETEGGAQFQGQSCPYHKPVVLSGSPASPRATESVTLAGAHSAFNEFFSEVFVSHRERHHSQRGPPPASSVK
jgi:hypothetical protein